MYWTKLLIMLLAAAITIIASACSKPVAPGGWSFLDTGTADAFYLANFVDENVGWLNGQTDRSFQPYQENANANKNVSPAKPGQKIEDPLKANQGFEILQTTDGGQTWRQMPDQLENKIRSVWFVNPQQGWALTINRDIMRSTDGGTTWTLQRKAGMVKLKLIGNRREPVMDQPEQIERIHFIDATHGWAWGGGQKSDYVEQPGVFLTTVDGGQNWNAVPYPFEQNIWSIFFLDRERAWASTTDGGFFKSGDGGLNWTKIESRRPPEDVFRAIHFLDDNNGWIAGRSGRLAKTTDGGRTWKKMVYIRNEFLMRDIFFMDKDQGWAVGDNGAILYTGNGGENWIDKSVELPAQLIDVVFVNNRAGWTIGMGGAAFRFVPD